MKIAKLIDGVMTVMESSTEFPNTSFPEGVPTESFLSENSYYKVEEPTFNPDTEKTADIAPVLVGNVVQTKEVVALSEEELSAKLALRVEALVLSVDANVDTIYRAVIGDRAVEYERAATEAKAYAAAGFTGTVPPYVATWVAASGFTPQAATENILAQSAAWESAALALRQYRLQAKAQLRAATTTADVDAAMLSWNSFLVYIQSQLSS